MGIKITRWARVVADRFDWFPRPGSMRTHARGEIVFLPSRALSIGVASGALVRIERPKGARINKAGVVLCNLSN